MKQPQAGPQFPIHDWHLAQAHARSSGAASGVTHHLICHHLRLRPGIQVPQEVVNTLRICCKYAANRVLRCS